MLNTESRLAAAIIWLAILALGLPMAANLAGAGHAVRGLDLSPAARDAAAAKGIAVDLGREVRVVFMSDLGTERGRVSSAVP